MNNICTYTYECVWTVSKWLWSDFASQRRIIMMVETIDPFTFYSWIGFSIYCRRHKTELQCALFHSLYIILPDSAGKTDGRRVGACIWWGIPLETTLKIMTKPSKEHLTCLWWPDCMACLFSRTYSSNIYSAAAFGNWGCKTCKWGQLS